MSKDIYQMQRFIQIYLNLNFSSSLKNSLMV